MSTTMTVPGHDRDALFAAPTAALNQRVERTTGLPEPDEYMPTAHDLRVARVAALG